MSPLSEYEIVQDYLFGLKAKGVRFGVDRMQLWTAALDHPDRKTPLIHVAGTNGKGSVSSMLETIYRGAGLKTGLYTSPHLVRLGERVQVARKPLQEDEIMRFVERLRPLAERVSAGSPDDHPSFFEFMTAMAFLKFAEARCDVGIIEVGMGGRLDATNVITPEISVITSIGLDHCEFLGDTHERIASEKAGIIKRGVPVVAGRMPPEALEVIRARARDQGSPFYAVEEAFGDGREPYPETSLSGEYQKWNAATATLVVRVLQGKWPVPPAAVASSLREVTWPGRWEFTRVDDRTLILDASHNPEGASTLLQNLRALRATSLKPLVVVVGVLGVARAKPLLAVLAEFASEIHLVVPNQPRACSVDELRRVLPSSFSGLVVDSTVEKIFPGPGRVSVGNPASTVLVTGSIYLLGEVLSRLEPSRGAIESRLQDF